MLNEYEKQIILGKNIAKYRKAKNLSQNELSELLNVSREHLAKIETGKRGLSLNLIFKISYILDVPETLLFKFDD